jgi:para-nitrobenzyl esterase
MRNHVRRVALAAGFLLLTIHGGLDAAAIQTVKTDLGKLSGVSAAGGVTAFLGVPFAAPPVGDLRWRPPQPAAPWKDVRKADRFGASCMQNEAGSRLPWTEEFMTQGAISEDCLFLNVWTPAPRANAKLAVMFWIYGGGFNEGSGQVAVYDGTELAKKGVIVVSVNYRVGPLGFLVHPELSQESGQHVSGNYGILDQIAALQWVHRNIAAFGGDPDRVTIFGESAGALSVAALMKSPLAGDYSRARSRKRSGPAAPNALGATATLGIAKPPGARYAESARREALADLRTLRPRHSSAGGAAASPRRRTVVQDGWVLPETRSHQVPLLVGFVADDIGVSGANVTPDQKPAARLRARRQRRSVRRGSSEGEQDDLHVLLRSRDSVARASRVRRVPRRKCRHVQHDCEDRSAVDASRSRRRGSDVVMLEQLRETGDPNGPGLPVWPACDPSAHVTMELGERMGPMPVGDAK